MDKVFKISGLIGTDIRSRANANIIRSVIDGLNGRIVLDFANVTFISRSFADELYNVMKEHCNLTLINESEFVKSMLNAVTQGRESKRMSINDTSEVKEIKDMKSLELFLSTI